MEQARTRGPSVVAQPEDPDSRVGCAARRLRGPSRAACSGDSGGWRRPGSGTLGDGASWRPEEPCGRPRPPSPPVTRRRLLLPSLGCADTSDATSLGSCRSEPSGAARSPSAPRTRVGSGLPSRPCGRRARQASIGAVPGAPGAGGAKQRRLHNLYIVAFFAQPGPPAGVRAPSPRVWCRQRGRIRSVSASSLPPLLLPPCW